MTSIVQSATSSAPNSSAPVLPLASKHTEVARLVDGAQVCGEEGVFKEEILMEWPGLLSDEGLAAQIAAQKCQVGGGGPRRQRPAPRACEPAYGGAVPH